MFLAPLAAAWIAGVLLLLLDGSRRAVAGLGAAVLLAVCAADLYFLWQAASGGAAEVVTGGWPPGVGIRLRGDATAHLFAAATSAVLAAVLAHHVLSPERFRAMPGLITLLCAGLHGVFLTGDAFNFYVFFELAMITSFSIASYGRGRRELTATIGFVMVNLLGSVLFLIAVASLYHVTGTLDFEQLGQRTPRASLGSDVLVGAMLVSAFALKLGMFPFHSWVPLVYRDARPASAAALAGALATIGIYGLIRFGTAALPTALEAGRPALVVLGAASALYGGVLAFGRRACAEVVAYSSVSHAGLLMLAFGIGGPHGIAAALVLAVASSLDKSTLFLTLAAPGAPARLASAVGATSIAGLPITAGFAAKLVLLQAAVDHPARWVLIPVVVVTSVLAIAYAFRAWRGLASGDWARSAGDRGEIAVALAVIVILLGLAPAGLVGLAYQAAGELAGGAG